MMNKTKITAIILVVGVTLDVRIVMANLANVLCLHRGWILRHKFATYLELEYR